MEFRRGRTFNNLSSHVCRWLTRTKTPITATVKMWSADFAEISRWIDTSDSASARKLLKHFCSPGARFVASSRIETLSSFRFGNRFFIASIHLPSQDKLFLCRSEMCNQKQNCKQEEFSISAVSTLQSFGEVLWKDEKWEIWRKFPFTQERTRSLDFSPENPPLSIKHFPQATKA